MIPSTLDARRTRSVLCIVDEPSPRGNKFSAGRCTPILDGLAFRHCIQDQDPGFSVTRGHALRRLGFPEQERQGTSK